MRKIASTLFLVIALWSFSVSHGQAAPGVCMSGLAATLSNPILLAVQVEGMYIMYEPEHPIVPIDAGHGPIAITELGLGGLILGLGYGYKEFVVPAGGTGYSVTLSYLRTWGDSITLHPGENFVGIEFRYDVSIVTGKVGFFHETGGGQDSLVLGIGLGF